MKEKIIQLRHLFISYYGIIIILFALYSYFAPTDGSMDPTITTIIVSFLVLFPIVMLYTLRYALHIFLFTLAFITGFYGFYQHSVDDHSISNALYFTFRLYLIDLADVFTSDGSSPITYPFLLEIARWSAAFYTISTIFIAMYRTLEKKIQLFFIQLFGGHHLIFSYNEKSRHLIQNLRKNGEKVMIVDKTFTTDTQNRLEKMKVIVIHGNAEDIDVFHECAVKKAKSLFLFHENDRDSLAVLMNLQTFSQKEQIQLNLKKAIIHIEDSRFQLALQTFLEKVEHFTFPVMMINVYEEVAKQFWRDHREILREEAHILIIGENDLGKNISQEAQKWSEYVDFTMIPGDEVDSLEGMVARQDQVFSHIFICLNEDYVDLMEGVELSERFANTPIFMYFTDEHIEQILLIAGEDSLLQSTGMIKDVLTMEYLDV